MKHTITLFVFLISFGVYAQKQTYDLVSYIPPTGWKKEVKQNSYTSYTTTNNQTNSYCQIFVMSSTTSKGGIDEDFKSEWQQLIVKSYGVTESPNITEPTTENGWTAKGGAANFTFNNGTSMALLTTMSGYNRAVSIVAVTNSEDYMPAIQKFLESVEMKKQETNIPVNQENIKPSGNSKYAFTTTNFDDGWVGTVQEDWVEVTKGSVKVLIHYPKEGTIIQADPEPLINNAWNILVAPRYRDIQNYKVAPTLMEYERGYFASANLTDYKTGKKVYVALYRKANSGWIEFITPDKNTFIANFGLDINTINYNSDSKIWEPLTKMVGYNKFAVAASDFPGKWSNNFANNTYYSNIYTGLSAGMSTYSSSETFEFASGTYKWNLVAANSYGGQSNFVNAKSSGTYKVLNNWQIYFSDIEKKPKTYNAYFSCIKGARILWLQDTGYGGYTSYGRVE